jgi:hypothetical protein
LLLTFDELLLTFDEIALPILEMLEAFVHELEQLRGGLERVFDAAEPRAGVVLNTLQTDKLGLQPAHTLRNGSIGFSVALSHRTPTLT